MENHKLTTIKYPFFSLPFGTAIVKSKAIPDKIIHPHIKFRLPQRFRVKSRKIYAGISTAPDITKFKYGFPPKLFVFHDKP